MKTRMMRVNANGIYKEKYYDVCNRARTNNDLVENYLSFYHSDCQTNNHWYYSNLFVSYNTPIAYQLGSHIICNAQRYSTIDDNANSSTIVPVSEKCYICKP